VKYFFDHQTDVVSFDLAEKFAFEGSEDIAPGVTLYLDLRRRPIAVEVRGASRILDTLGLNLLHETPITAEEISDRMSSTTEGQLLWRAVVRRMLAPYLQVQKRSAFAMA